MAKRNYGSTQVSYPEIKMTTAAKRSYNGHLLAKKVHEEKMNKNEPKSWVSKIRFSYHSSCAYYTKLYGRKLTKAEKEKQYKIAESNFKY